MEPFERAAAGVFLAFQYPMEIPGVATMTFLRTAVNAVRKARGEAELSTPDFLRLVREKAKLLKIDPEMLKRPLNVGFSGGEKKRNEILQMTLLDPSLCVLDETDSGLDIDAIRIVAEGVNALGSPERPCWSSPTTSGCSTTSCRTACMCCPTGGWRAPAAPSLRSSSKQTGYAEFGGKAALRESKWIFRSNSSRTKAEQAYLDMFAAAGKALPGAAIHSCRRSARQGDRGLRPARPAASPHRGLEIYRPPRPADRRQSAAEAPKVSR